MLSLPREPFLLVMPYAGPLLAAGAALLGALLCRAKARRPLLPAVGALAALAGWAAMLPRATVLQAASETRTDPGLLLLPGVVAVTLSLLGVWAQRQRFAALVLVIVVGWWVAGSPAGKPEFWRVCAATILVGAVLSGGTAREPSRGLASAVALWGGLLLTRAASGWAAAALTAAGAWAGLLAAGQGAVIPAGLMAGLVVAADLAGGQLVRGSVRGADVACVLACAGPYVAGGIGAHARKLGRAGPALAGLAAGLLLAGLAWAAQRAIRP
jgi:hypothetical protein